MKTRVSFFTIIALLLAACTDFGNTENPLFGIIYKDPAEVPQLKSYKNIEGSVLENKDKTGNYMFRISHLSDSLRNLLLFEKLIQQESDAEPSFQILDTIHVNNIKEKQYITYCNCSQDKVANSGIIALVIANDNAYFDQIVKAWRADTLTGKITELKNTKGITCTNEGYGLEDCGE
jgi:hypothetical protein